MKAGKTHIYSPGNLVLAQIDEKENSKRIGIIIEPTRTKWSGRPCWRILVGEETFIFFEFEMEIISK